MDQAQISAELQKVKNMAAFAVASKVGLRTLWKVARNEGPVLPSTLTLIELQLQKIKPAKKAEAEKKAA